MVTDAEENMVTDAEENMVTDVNMSINTGAGVMSIFDIEPEYPYETEVKKGRKRPEIVDPYGWCSYESSENKKITRIYKNGKVTETKADGRRI